MSQLCLELIVIVICSLFFDFSTAYGLKGCIKRLNADGFETHWLEKCQRIANVTLPEAIPPLTILSPSAAEW